MNVKILLKSTGKSIFTYPIHLGGTLGPVEKDYFDEAWRCAVDDKLVSEDERDLYQFELLNGFVADDIYDRNLRIRFYDGNEIVECAALKGTLTKCNVGVGTSKFKAIKKQPESCFDYDCSYKQDDMFNTPYASIDVASFD